MESDMRTRTLRIDGMYDDTCEGTVRAALKDVQGVTVESVRMGGATIRCDGRVASGAACAAINAAGFRAWETRPPRQRTEPENEPAARQEGTGVEPTVAGRNRAGEGAGAAMGHAGSAVPAGASIAERPTGERTPHAESSAGPDQEARA